MATVRKPKAKGLPKRYRKRTLAGYYTRAFARTAVKKLRNVARQEKLAARKNTPVGV